MKSAQSPRGFLVSLLIPFDASDLLLRGLAAVLTIAIAAAVGNWFCSEEGPWAQTWWACGMSGIVCAAAVAGWVGGRMPALIPFLVPPLTAALTLASMQVADEMGHPLDAYYGISAAGLAVFSGFAGAAALVPVAALRACWPRPSGRRCPEQESYEDGVGRRRPPGKVGGPAAGPPRG
jgi:hypothetical protein